MSMGVRLEFLLSGLFVALLLGAAGLFLMRGDGFDLLTKGAGFFAVLVGVSVAIDALRVFWRTGGRR